MLGNPNKHFYRNDALFLNYLELGFDLMISPTDYTVKKFILHTNNPNDPNFTFHNRCFYELHLPPNTPKKEIEVDIEEEVKEDTTTILK